MTTLLFYHHAFIYPNLLAPAQRHNDLTTFMSRFITTIAP